MLGMRILGSRLALVDRRNGLGLQCCESKCDAGCHEECWEQKFSRGSHIEYLQFNLWQLGGICLCCALKGTGVNLRIDPRPLLFHFAPIPLFPKTIVLGAVLL